MGKDNTYKDLPIGARIAIAVSLTVGVGLFSISLIRFDWTQYWAFLFILAVAGVTANTTVRLLGGSSLSLLTSVVLMSLISLGPDGAVMIAICGVVFQTAVPARTVFSYTLAFNVGMIGVTVWGAGRAYQLLIDSASAGSLVALLVASLVYYFGNSVFVSMIVGLSSRKSPLKIWHDHFLYTAPAFFMAGVLAFAANEILKAVHFSVLLVLAPILYFSYYPGWVTNPGIGWFSGTRNELRRVLNPGVGESGESVVVEDVRSTRLARQGHDSACGGRPRPCADEEVSFSVVGESCRQQRSGIDCRFRMIRAKVSG